jgi:hypothetical protein
MTNKKDPLSSAAIQSVDQLLEPARHLPPGEDRIWLDHRFIWPSSWMPQLTAWLASLFRGDGMRRLRPGVFRDLCWDDLDWSRVLDKCLTADIEYQTGKLAEPIEPAVLRTLSCGLMLKNVHQNVQHFVQQKFFGCLNVLFLFV